VRLSLLCLVHLVRVAQVVVGRMLCRRLLACSGGCFSAVVTLVGDRFGQMLGRLGCVGWVDALPSLLSCRPLHLDDVVSFSRFRGVVLS
jgi:hypothetical protein